MAEWQIWLSGDGGELAQRADIDSRPPHLHPEGELFCSFEAATPEEAEAIYSLRMGWANGLGERSLCEACGAFIYPERSGVCWRCGTVG
jgi:hypothetical protein